MNCRSKKRSRFMPALVMVLVLGMLLSQAATSFANNNGDVLTDIQQVAKQEGITMEEATARYGWQESFVSVVKQIRDSFSDQYAGSAITNGGRGAWIAFKEEVPETAVDLAATLPVNVRLVGGRGFSEAELKQTLEQAFYAINDDGDVVDAVGHYDVETGVITIEAEPRETPGDAVSRERLRVRLQPAQPANDAMTINVSIVEKLDGGVDTNMLITVKKKPWGRVMVVGVVLLAAASFLGYRGASDGRQTMRTIVTGDDPRILVQRNQTAAMEALITAELGYDPAGRCLFLVDRGVGLRWTPVWPEGTKSILENGKYGVIVPRFGKIFAGETLTADGGGSDTPRAGFNLPERCLTPPFWIFGGGFQERSTGDGR